ncbi:hypothetical protein OWM07_03920 [Deferribacter thermophilus]|uniref:hypothetical protein n=1 Tax=Deferribacter thermophilus TaxID=53573 RepID=UPI003C1DC204
MKTLFNNKPFVIFILLFVVFTVANALDSELWTDYLQHNQKIKCQGSQDPEPYEIDLYESPCGKDDPVSQWACKNGFILAKACNYQGIFVRKEIYKYTSRTNNNKTVQHKDSVQYCVSVCSILFPGYSGCIDCDGIGGGIIYLPENKNITDYDISVSTAADAPPCQNSSLLQNSPDLKFKCETFKSNADSYFASIVAILRGSNNLQQTDKENESEVKSDIDIYIKKENYEPVHIKKEIKIKSSEYSKYGRILVRGTVKDKNSNKPIHDAQIKINFNNKTYKLNTDKFGGYREFLIITGGGASIYTIYEDILLVKKKQKLNIKVTPTNLVANGKEQKLIFQLSMPDGTPAANKIFRVRYSHEPFQKDGKTVDYLTRPIIIDNLKTNSEGKGAIFIPTPKIKKGMLNNIKNPETKFPVQVKFNIFEDSDLVGSFIINFQNPIPKITKFLLPCGMDAENWQIQPSKVFIEDLDSNEFYIEVQGYGKFKVRGGKIYNTLLRVRNFKGNVFEFYLASKKLGLDLNEQPDMWKELLETNLKVAANVLITYSSGKLLSDVRNALQKGSKLEKILIINGRIKSEVVVSVSQNSFGTSDYYNNTLSFINDENKDYVKSQDMVVGGVLLGAGIRDLVTRASVSIGAAMQMELMKAIYENAKTIYGIYKKYRKISDSYRDIIFIPILVKVTDKEGYSAITFKNCGVRIWKEVE